MKPLCAFLIALGSVAAASGASPDFLPLQAGNRWVYRAADGSGETFTIAVFTPVMLNDKAYYKVSGYAIASLFVRKGDHGELYWWDPDSERDEVLTLFEHTPGGWFDTTIDGCPQGGQPQPSRVETLAPAGAFDSALEIKYRDYGCGRGRGVQNELYLENIGLLRRTANTYGGVRTFELVYARVGGMRLHGEAGTTFRVGIGDSLIERQQASETLSMPVSLRLSVDRGWSVPLRYNTSQRFDIQIRDKAGAVVYRWSDDVVYAQVMQQEDGYEIERRLDVPLRSRSGAPLPDGEYLLEGWFTTPDKQFASASAFGIVTAPGPAPAGALRLEAGPTAPGNPGRARH